MLSGSGSSETVDVTLLWSGPGVTDHPIDEFNAANGGYQTYLILFTHEYTIIHLHASIVCIKYIV